MSETPRKPLDGITLSVLVSIDAPDADDIDNVWLGTLIRVALTAAGTTEPAEVSLLLTGDETVRYLNAAYRGLDETTDVLSFSAEYAGRWEGDGDGPVIDFSDRRFVLPRGVLPPLGEIIISWPQAQRQAEGRGVSPQRELAALVIHGALHLLGYDHAEPEEAMVMGALERRALEESLPFPE